MKECQKRFWQVERIFWYPAKESDGESLIALEDAKQNFIIQFKWDVDNFKGQLSLFMNFMLLNYPNLIVWDIVRKSIESTCHSTRCD